ncbi:MAG TPA: S26 family signal peptidase [Candidatus Limnocylindrales bacterium]|nr:S26 family signal peptidase [Candidatus Limnocylindrales bacterium]
MRRPGLLLGAALGVLAGFTLAPPLARIARSWPHRVAVFGHSMEPTLHAGDWLLVDPDAFIARLPAPGELCVAHYPRAPQRLIVKRATWVTGSTATLASDHPAHSAAEDTIGPVAAAEIVGRPWFRYWPLDRFGRVG